MTDFDLSTTIAARSDQLNGDDLIGGPITITITNVTPSGAKEQPACIHYQGDEGKPYKPCLTMRRLLIGVWGKQGSKYAGRQMTLYRDPKVRFGPDVTGGIRISHVSGITEPFSMQLQVSKGKRATFVLKPLAATAPTVDRAAELVKMQAAAAKGETELRTAWEAAAPEVRKALAAELEALKATAKEADPAEPEQPAADQTQQQTAGEDEYGGV